MRLLSTLFFIVAILTHSTAQDKQLSRGNQQWIQYYNKIKIGEKWVIQTDGGFRWKNGFKESKQFIIRTGLGYAINQSVQVSCGFAHLGFFFSEKINQLEFRPYQEVKIKSDFKKLILTHRFRIEERFFNPVIDNEIQSSNSFNFRFRYAFMVKFTLLKLSKTKPDCKFLMNIGNEVYLNAGNNIVSDVFDQNRVIVSPTVQLNKNLSVSLTWNSQFSSTAAPSSYRYTDVFWVQLKHKLDFHHKKVNDLK